MATCHTPSKGITKGETFDDIALGVYENQYTKDTIGYDYLPKLILANPTEGLPNWQVDSMFPTNMSLICRPMFTPKHTFQHADDRLAAFVDNEIRGLCQRNETDHLFYLSIGGQVDDNKKITLKLYSGEMKKTWVMDSAFTSSRMPSWAALPHPMIAIFHQLFRFCQIVYLLVA